MHGTREPPHEQRRRGELVAVQGNVVDARFAPGLPPLRRKLTTGLERTVPLEVAAHLDARTVRAIALGPTRGLARGMPVHDTGRPLEAPVGMSLLGRMLDVFGEPIDDGPAIMPVRTLRVDGEPLNPAARASPSDCR